jgi:NADH dehydrogenase subunit M (EC 1.6.5.3)
MNVIEIAALNNIPVDTQKIFFPFIFIGFGVLGALFPFHTWSPDGHASAPTAVSMLHAGVLMKLGGYGCFRVAMYLLPDAANELAWIFLILTTISVVYGAFSACVQTDLKYINAYSSVSHCRLGALCSVDDDKDFVYGCYPANVVTRFDDGPLLCTHRYDLWTYTYP